MRKVCISVEMFRRADIVTRTDPFYLLRMLLVELELALFDDAAGKFGRVLQGQDKTINAIAAYGQGVALMSIAQRDFQGGKAGSAFAEIQRAIDSCLNFSENFACTRKLLGDLYSFGASLPPNVFNDSGNSSADECIQKQLEFVAKGENAYRSVLGVQDFSKSDKNTVLRASSICDVASNILLQAQTLSSRHECGNALEAGRVPEVDDLYERASKEFRSAIETVPLYAPAWCGFGCAIVAKDPLLAQHAFCRCLQLEKMFSDAYANVGFLYTSQQAFKASENVMNALTQVADTPMMWMNRAFILERGAATNLEQNDSAQAERDISRAADAYRAALQVMKHPDAQLGLSVTGRMMLANDKLKDENSRSVVYRSRRKDSLALMKAFMGSTYRLKDMASLFCGVMEIEQANEALAASWSTELFKRGCKATTTALGEESMKGSINTGAVAGCLEKDENAPMEEKTNNLNFPIQVSLQRQIIHEPSRADLWLSLAKLLIGSLGQSSPPRAIESALEAANRASTMLAGELIQPHRVHGVSASYVKSEILSEGLSLVHWLGNFKNKKKEESNNKSSYELQRSLMMCPNNPLAREALKLNQ